MGKPTRWNYHGLHCAKLCATARAGKMCQCRFDRRYERIKKREPELTSAEVTQKVLEEAYAKKTKVNSRTVC